MRQSAVSDELDAVKSSPHTGTSRVWNLGEAPFSAEDPTKRINNKLRNAEVLERSSKELCQLPSLGRQDHINQDAESCYPEDC